MRTLYESILDSDEDVLKAPDNAICEKIINFLKDSNYAKFCTFEQRGDQVFVHGPKGYAEFKKFKFSANSEYIILTENTRFVDDSYFLDIKFFDKHVNFDKCEIELIYAFAVPQFLSK